MNKYVFLLFALSLAIAGCTQRFDKKLDYVARVFIVHKAEKDGKAKLVPYKGQKIDLCFNDGIARLCAEGISEHRVLVMRSQSKSIQLSSLDLIGGKYLRYAFKDHHAPKVKVDEYADVVYLGRIMVEIVEDEKKGMPKVALFADCDEKWKEQDVLPLVKFKKVPENAKIVTACMNIGQVFHEDGKAVSMMPVMPPRTENIE